MNEKYNEYIVVFSNYRNYSCRQYIDITQIYTCETDGDKLSIGNALITSWTIFSDVGTKYKPFVACKIQDSTYHSLWSIWSRWSFSWGCQSLNKNWGRVTQFKDNTQSTHFVLQFTRWCRYRAPGSREGNSYRILLTNQTGNQYCDVVVIAYSSSYMPNWWIRNTQIMHSWLQGRFKGLGIT